MWQDLPAKLTNLGDPILLMLGAVGIFFYLWSAEERRVLARGWALAFGVCVLLTIFSKFVFHLVRWNQGSLLRLLSPSGHVAIGTGFYGCCAILLTIGYGRAVRVLVGAGAVLLIGVLAASRLMLGLHSVLEIVVAFAIGGISLVVFTLYPNSERSAPLKAGHVICLLFLIFVAYYVPHVDGETLIIKAVQNWSPRLD